MTGNSPTAPASTAPASTAPASTAPASTAPASRAAAGRTLLALVLVLTGGAGAAAWPAAGAAQPPADPAELVIGGVAFHDRDADGHRDAGEPGLPGLRVHHSSGAPVTTTGADGRYRLAGLPATGRLVLQAGWLRSQCYDPEVQDCPAGPGDDNDFPTRNQFFELPLAGRGSADDVDAALLPDWPGPGMAPPAPVGGAVPANPVDVAARLSGGPDTCGADAFGICAAGDTYERFGQLHNQGTRPVTGLRATVLVPPGDCLTGVTVVAAATSEGVGPLATDPPAGAWTCDTRVVELAFPGTLVPAGAIRLSITGTVRAGPGTPGCTLTAPPAATCSAAAPQGRTLMLGISRIDQRGDPDSGFCARRDLRTCATGLHDKRREPDDVDPAGHNVDAALGGTDAFNLRMAYAVVEPRGRRATVRAGQQVRVRGWVHNLIDGYGYGGGPAPANQAHPGAAVRFHFPAGTGVVELPAPHPLRGCAVDPPPPGVPPPGAAAAPVGVTCVFHSPLAPHVSSLALDLLVRVPGGWPAGRPYRSVACAAPVAGQAGETVPAGGPPCDLTAWPPATATDNDALLLLATR